MPERGHQQQSQEARGKEAKRNVDANIDHRYRYQFPPSGRVRKPGVAGKNKANARSREPL